MRTKPYRAFRTLDRRQFLKATGALGLAPSAATLLKACGGDDQQRQAGGTLRAVLDSDIRGFDVQRFYDTQSVTLADLVFSRLVAIDPEDPSRVVPDLAAEVPEPENGGTRWTFTLRDDAVFHDGSPVTAEDVKYSIERLIDARTRSEGGAYYTGWIEGTEALAEGEDGQATGIRALDERTVRFELTEPRAAFLQLMGIWFASIYPRAYVERVGTGQFNREPIGSGPFSVDSYRPGRSVSFLRFDDYYDSEDILLDGIQLNLAVSGDTALLQIDGGELDVLASEVPPAGYESIRNDPSRAERLVEGTVDNCNYLTLNDVDQSGIFRSVEGRRAIHQAIDKERILQQMQGRGEIATGFWSPTSPYYDEDFPSVEYDPDAARQTLEDVGAAGQEVEIYVPADGSFFPLDQWGPAIEQDLEEVGLRPTLRTLEFSAWLGRTMTPEAIVPNGWSMDIPHGSFVIDSAFTEATKEAAEEDDTCCNFSRWASARVDELNETGVTTTDKQEEIEAYREIMRIAIGEEHLWVPVVWPTRAYYRSERVEGMEVNPNAAGLLLSRLSLST